MTKLISELKVGETAIIKEFRDIEMSLSLMEMGCLPGIAITLENTAPLGGAVAIKVLDYKLAISQIEASAIVVNA